MFKSFFSKLTVTFTIIIVLVITSIVYFQNYYFTSMYLSSTIEDIVEESINLSEEVTGAKSFHDAQEKYEDNIDFLAKKYNALILVTDTKGNILDVQQGHENFTNKQIPNKVFMKYITPLIEGQGKYIVSFEMFTVDEDNQVLTIGVPVFANGKIVGIVLTNVYVSSIVNVTKSITQNLWLVPVVALFISILLVYLASRFISNPLNELNKLAKEASRGNFNYRIDVNSDTEIGHIGENMNKMMNRLGQMDHFRSDFVQNASHELKAPITVISGYSQALKDDSITVEKRHEYLDIILNETDRMKQLIETLMNLSKIESGNMSLNKEHFNINDLISRKLIAFEIEIEKKELEIEVNYEEDNLQVYADKAQIEHVIVNLIQNAIKYTENGDKLIITTKQVKAKAYIEIMDTGIGMEEKDLESIFDRFYTVDKAKTPGKTGSGIGLSLVKKILEIHDSQIKVESKKDEFSKFYFYLDM